MPGIQMKVVRKWLRNDGKLIVRQDKAFFFEYLRLIKQCKVEEKYALWNSRDSFYNPKLYTHFVQIPLIEFRQQRSVRIMALMWYNQCGRRSCLRTLFAGFHFSLVFCSNFRDYIMCCTLYRYDEPNWNAQFRVSVFFFSCLFCLLSWVVVVTLIYCNLRHSYRVVPIEFIERIFTCSRSVKES